MKKVLLIGPNTLVPITDMRWCTAPLGVHHIASYLNSHGHKAEVWDCNLNGEPFADAIKRERWDFVGFSVLEATVETDLARIHEAKRLSPNSLLVAGGTGASLNYQTLFEKSPLDLVVFAEGEIPILELCEGKPWQDIDGIVFRRYARQMTKDEYWNIRKCLDMKAMRAREYWAKTAALYESPDWNEVNTFRIYTMSHCPMGCNFCTLTRLRRYSCGKDMPVVALEVGQVTELTKRVMAEYPECRQIFIVDDDAFLMPNRTIELCRAIIAEKIAGGLPKDLKFICLTNINRLNEGNLPLIAEAGFRVISIGVESTSQKVLDSYNKRQTVHQIWETTKLILRYGIRPYYTLILFSPSGEIDDLQIDLAGFRKLADMGAGLSIEPFLIPLRGTEFFERGYRQRIRECKIAGTNLSIHKGFAWLPQDAKAYEVFEVFESVYPRYRKYVFGTTPNIHHEKNFQSKIILDSLEYVLRARFGLNVIDARLADSDLAKMECAVARYGDMDVDVVGNVIEKGAGM